MRHEATASSTKSTSKARGSLVAMVRTEDSVSSLPRSGSGPSGASTSACQGSNDVVAARAIAVNPALSGAGAAAELAPGHSSTGTTTAGTTSNVHVDVGAGVLATTHTQEFAHALEARDTLRRNTVFDAFDELRRHLGADANEAMPPNARPSDPFEPQAVDKAKARPPLYLKPPGADVEDAERVTLPV